MIQTQTVVRLAAIVFASWLVSACSTTLGNKPVFQDDGIAIEGYDPVAYFEDNKAVKGSAQYSLEWRGVSWYFASASHKQTFVRNPEKYAPQYGGYCSYAMANGYVVSSDPEAWTVKNGKLYLNYSKGVRDSWLKDADGYIARADKSWQEKIAAQ